MLNPVFFVLARGKQKMQDIRKSCTLDGEVIKSETNTLSGAVATSHIDSR